MVFNQNRNGSEFIYTCICENSIETEKQVLDLFNKNFKHRKDYGNEYFEGDIKDMVKLVKKF